MSDLAPAILSALAMEPGRPGVARLCRELLAEISGQEIASQPVEMVVRRVKNLGNKNARRVQPNA